jgi:hypothetical protein
MTIPLESLPEEVRLACMRLCNELKDLLGPELISLWAYGAATRPDRPKRLGDVDTHGVLRSRPARHTAVRIEELHAAIARDLGIEWDSWYVVGKDARSAPPPKHALRENLVDSSWSLHRAHWLAGEYVLLHGCTAANLIQPPTWPEMEAGLRGELSFLTRLSEEGGRDADHTAYAVSNACRIIYSLENRNVVVSKRAAALWALEHMPASWQPAISAAIRVYDGEDDKQDASVLQRSMAPIIAAAAERLACTEKR